jgi:hypothetical protein
VLALAKSLTVAVEVQDGIAADTVNAIEAVIMTGLESIPPRGTMTVGSPARSQTKRRWI